MLGARSTQTSAGISLPLSHHRAAARLGSMRHRSEADTDETERRGSGRITGNENREICKTFHWWHEISVD